MASMLGIVKAPRLEESALTRVQDEAEDAPDFRYKVISYPSASNI